MKNFRRRDGKIVPLTKEAIRYLVAQYTTRHLACDPEHFLDWALPWEKALWGVVDYTPSPGMGCTAVSKRLVRAAIRWEEQQTPFGAGLPRRLWMAKRVLFALEVARMQGSDGWHDAYPCVGQREKAWEREARQAIFDASMSVGAYMLAYDPKNNAGVIASLAEALGGPTAGTIPANEQDANFLAIVLPRLGLEPQDLVEALEV